MEQKLQKKNSMKIKILPFIAAFSFFTNSPACAEYIGAANISEQTDRVYYIMVQGKNPVTPANKSGILTWTDVAFGTGIAAVSYKCAEKKVAADTDFYVLYTIGKHNGWWQVNCDYAHKVVSEFGKDSDGVLMLLNQEGRKEFLHPLLIVTKQQAQNFQRLRQNF